MKDLSILGLAGIALFLLWNGSRSKYTQEFLTAERVPPNVLQAIIEKIQEKFPDWVPLETLFINHKSDGSYRGRFMFLNTRKYLATQLEVSANVNKDGSVEILSQQDPVVEDYARAYKPDAYQPYSEIKNSIDSQLKYALSKPITTPPLDAYKY